MSAHNNGYFMRFSLPCTCTAAQPEYIMNRARHNKIWLCLITALLMASAMLVVSCSPVEENEGELNYTPLDDHDTFKLRFRLCSRIPGSSRAADIAGKEHGSAAENIINLKDIRYYIFDMDGNFILDLTSDIDEDKSHPISDDYSLYEVVARIDASKADYFKRSDTGTVDFYLMVLANFSETSGYEGVKLPVLGPQNKLSDMFTTPTTPVINRLPDTERLMKAASNEASRNYIPMAGLQYFSVSRAWFETMFGKYPVDLTEITGKSLNMLRSVAKIEIVDRINMKPGEIFDKETDAEKIRIQSVSINGVMKNFRLLPTENQWKRNFVFETQQVISPSLPESYRYLLPPALDNDEYPSTDNPETGDSYSLPFVYDAVATQKRDDHCRVYSCYVWEYSRKNDIPLAQLPYLSVTVKNPVVSSDAALQGVEIPTLPTYNVLLKSDMTTSATDPAPLQYILRNHIYRYEISGAGTAMTIKWSVCPMDKASTDITFN